MTNFKTFQELVDSTTTEIWYNVGLECGKKTLRAAQLLQNKFKNIHKELRIVMYRNQYLVQYKSTTNELRTSFGRSMHVITKDKFVHLVLPQDLTCVQLGELTVFKSFFPNTFKRVGGLDADIFVDVTLSDDDVIKLTYPIIVRAKQHFNKSMSHTYIKSLAETLGTDLYKQITG